MNVYKFSNFNRYTVHILPILIIFGVYFFLVPNTNAQTVTLTPQSASVNKDSKFSLSLDVSSVTDLFGIGFDLDFDPSLISFIDATEGGFLSSGCQSGLFAGENAPGKLVVGSARHGVSCGGVSGSGNIMTLNFKALSNTGTAIMSFSKNVLCILLNSQCNNTTGTWIPTSITIDATPQPDTIPPVLLSGSPSGTLSSGTQSTSILVVTDEPATCRYSTSTGINYLLMSNTFTTTGSTSHTTLVSNLQDGHNYNYYIRCQDVNSNANTSDYLISFSVSQTPQALTCTSFTYSAWSPTTCPSDQTQTRTVQTSSPLGCVGGTPIFTQSCVYTPPTINTITSLKTLTPITIDGNKESIWNQANTTTFQNPSKSDNIVKVYTLYDNNNLYFLYQVTDNNLEATNTNIWQDDGAEIYIDTQNNKSTTKDANDYSFLTNINDLTSNTSITVKTFTTSTGYIQEIKIPFTTLNITPNNQTLGLLLANNDRDNSQSSQFDNQNLINTGSYARPNLWGNLSLSTQTIETPSTLTADINTPKDGLVNSLDWSIMNASWGTSNAQADLNNDGVVNTIDWSIMNGEWSG